MSGDVATIRGRHKEFIRALGILFHSLAENAESSRLILCGIVSEGCRSCKALICLYVALLEYGAFFIAETETVERNGIFRLCGALVVSNRGFAVARDLHTLLVDYSESAFRIRAAEGDCVIVDLDSLVDVALYSVPVEIASAEIVRCLCVTELLALLVKLESVFVVYITAYSELVAHSKSADAICVKDTRAVGKAICRRVVVNVTSEAVIVAKTEVVMPLSEIELCGRGIAIEREGGIVDRERLVRIELTEVDPGLRVTVSRVLFEQSDAVFKLDLARLEKCYRFRV